MEERKDVVIKCPECGLKLSFKPMPNYRIKKVTCPKCKHVATAGEYELIYDPSMPPESGSDTVIDSPATTSVTIKCVETGEQFSLKPGKNRLGRRCMPAKADILFDDPEKYISKLHSSISVVNAGGTIQLHLRDEGSTNGTFINEKRVPQGSIAFLKPSDTLRMGRRTFVCTIMGAAGKPWNSNRPYDSEDTQLGNS